MIAALLIASLSGCMNNPIQAPTTATIEAPASVALAWAEEFNGLNDGIGAVIIGDFYVVDSVTDMPLENIEVEVISNSGGVYLLPPEALRVADFPSIPDGLSMSDCVDEDGNFDNTVYEWCGWVYDTVRGSYIEFGSDYADNGDGGDPFRPTYMTSATDDRGLLRFFAYVDALAESGDSFDNAQIVGSIGVDSASFEVGPGGGN